MTCFNTKLKYSTCVKLTQVMCVSKNNNGYRCMRIVSIHLPETYIQGLDELVRMGLFPSRSEAVRVAVRDLLRREQLRMRKWRRSRYSYMVG